MNNFSDLAEGNPFAELVILILNGAIKAIYRAYKKLDYKYTL